MASCQSTDIEDAENQGDLNNCRSRHMRSARSVYVLHRADLRQRSRGSERNFGRLHDFTRSAQLTHVLKPFLDRVRH